MIEICRRKTVDGLALPRMSDVGTANGHNPSDADTPFTFASIPGADDTTGDSIGLEAAERPQVHIRTATVPTARAHEDARALQKKCVAPMQASSAACVTELSDLHCQTTLPFAVTRSGPLQSLLLIVTLLTAKARPKKWESFLVRVQK
jgi:hypothetical protein